MEDKRKALYDALSGEYDLGSYEDFTTKLNDENKRRALYDAAGQDYNLGSYEEYSEKLGFGSEPSGIVPMFNDEPQGAPMPENVEENSRKLRGLWANFKESSKGLWAGLKGYAGEQLNLFTGSSREEQAALNDIEQLEEQGVDVMQYLADKEDAEFHKSYGMSKDQFLALDKKVRKRLVRQASERMLEQQSVVSDAQLKELKRRQTNQQIVEDAFNNALEIAGGDLTRAKEILREQAADKTKGDILIEEATETMNNLRQPEGFAGWVGNMLPQMVPAAASIAINYLTKGKASGLSKALGYGTMGGLTLSTAGMSMIEARNAGATNLEVWATGIADGAIEIISEKIPFDRVTKRVFSSAKANVAEKLGNAVLTPKGRKELEKLLSDANEKLGGKLFSKKNIGEWLTDTAYEAAGEFTAEALQTITTMIYENPEDYPTISEVLANGWEGAKAGLFMGSITGGASLAASHAMNKDRRQTQGYVDVAQMENENGDVEVVEVVGEDPQTGNVTILHGDTVEEVSQDKLGDRFRFSYEEFENGRLRSREDDAIDNGVVNDGQIRGMEETIQKDLNELRNFFTEDEINQIASGTIPSEANAEGVAAARKYMDDVQRIDDLHAAKAEQDQKRKAAVRDRIESEVGQRFWVQEEGEDDGSGIIPVAETVEEVVYSDGRVGYVVGSDEAGNLTMVYNDGSRGFSSRAEIAEKENSGEILSNTVMGLDDYLAIKVDIEDVTAETTRMEQEQTANVQSVKASHPVGSIINVGTAEAKVEVPVIATTADGVIVQMPDGTTPQLTWADVAHAEGQEVKPKTNAELDQEIVDEYRVAYQPAVKTGQEPSITEREIEVEQTTPANPLPLKADGSVDQTALWNKDPERWAQWNDEQRQDGGANTLAYVSGAIAKEQAKIAELQAAYEAESDFDARNVIEKQIADTQERVGRLTAIQQGYVAQAEAVAAPAKSEYAQTELDQSVPVTARQERTTESVLASLTDGTLTDEEIRANIDANLAEAKKAYDKYAKKAPKMGIDKDAYLAEKQKYEQGLPALQQEIDFWNGVKGIYENVMQQEVLPTAESFRLELAEEDMNPRTPQELAARELGLMEGGIKLLWDSVKAHTGFGNGERQKFFGIFRSKDKGGMTIEAAGDRLMEMDREYNLGLLDQNDPMAGVNAILDVLGDVQTIGDLRNYIANNREIQVAREADAAYSAMNAEFVATHGMTMEDAAHADHVAMLELMHGKALSEAEQYEINVKFAEEENHYGTDYSSETGAVSRGESGENQSDVARGVDSSYRQSDSILQETQSDITRGETISDGQAEENVSESNEQDGDSSVYAGEQAEEIEDLPDGVSESSLDEDMPDFTNSASAYFPSEETRRKFSAMRARIKDWAQKLGVQVSIMETLDDVVNQSAREQILKGRKVYGYFDTATGEVAFYLPDFLSTGDEFLSEIDKTYIHEVVAHRGLRGLLGEEKYGELCDMVWDAMTEQQKAKFLNYPGVNGNTRAAADEFIAHFAENVDYADNRTMWDKIVDFIKDLFGSISIPVEISNESMAGLLRQSYIKLAKDAKAATNANANQQAEGNTVLRAANGSLVGMHNISEDKLRKVIKQGGSANPSTAVIDIDRQDFTSYGDISLVMPSSLVDAETGRNAGTFTADAWTPTYPKVERRFSDDELQRKYWRDISAIPEEMQHEVRMAFDSWLDSRNDSGLAYMFLQERGEAPEMVRVEAKFPQEIKDKVSAILGEGRTGLYELSAEEKQAMLELYIMENFGGNREEFDKSIAERIQKIEDRLSAGKVPSFVEKRITVDLQWMKEHGYDYDQLSEFVRAIAADIRHAGEVNDSATTTKALDYIKENNLSAEFEKWKENLSDRYGIKEYLFDGYTPSGNQRWLPNTVENASRLMNKQGLQGATGMAVNFNRFVATLAPKKKSLSEIRASKERLVEDEQLVDAFRDKWSEVFFDLGVKCQPDAKGYEDYGLERLTEAAQKKNPGAYLKKEYGVELSQEDLQKLSDMIKAIKTEFPARYFETKFQRPVYLNEFAAAVMPTTTSEDIKQAVSEAGLPIFEYDSSVEGSRKEATLKATEGEGVRFRAAPSDRVLSLFNQARAGELGGKPISIGSLTKEGKEYLERISGIKLKENVSFVLNPSDLNHIYNDHYGKNEKDTGNNIPLNDYDIRRLVDVIAFPTRVVFGEDKQGRKVFYFLSETPSGTYNLMEIYANKKGNLTAKTYYKTKKGATQRVMELESLLSTSETYSGATLSDAKIPILFDIANEPKTLFRARITPEQDKAYMDAVAAGDMETAQRMVEEAARLAGYDSNSDYQGSLAFNGAAPSGYAYYDTKEERIEAWESGEYEDDQTLGDYKDAGIDISNLGWSLTSPVAQRMGNEYTRESIKNLADAVNSDSRKIKVYRAVDADIKEDSVRNGDWVTPSRAYAEYHIGLQDWKEGRIIEQEVDIDDIWWDGNDINEWGYNDGKGYAYKNTPNNRKLLAPVTYDDNGKVIPLSERFNEEKSDIRFRIANENQAIFVSNAAKAVEGIKMEKATPEQWLKMIEKNGGLKAGEDKWMGLSDWLKESDKKTLTKQEVLDFINENMIQIEEVHYAAGAEDDAENTYAMIERILQEKFGKYIAEYYEQNSGEDDDLYGGDSYEYAMDKLREEMNDKFPYTIERSNSVVYLTFPYEETDDLQEWADKLGIKFVPQNPINSTRLDYTTDGLNNKHEIALTVPTIESWNDRDEVHFGDAGDGRAVAWIRFGDKWEQRPSPQISRKVLVIDEIQSKRHQEGREKGYKSKDYWPLRISYLEKKTVYESLYDEMAAKYGEEFTDAPNEEFAKRVLDAEDYERIMKAKADFDAAADAYIPMRNAIPDAPFDKNWHELAMKRMLRYAAENGYDVIAWTTGDQQAERYNIGSYVSSIEMQEEYDGNRDFGFYMGDSDEATTVTVDENGIVVSAEGHLSQAEGRPLADLVGKDMAVKMMQMEEYDVLEDTDLKVGNEGMKGFYDRMLPAFMNKYGKKWGVKVEDIELRGLENGLTMHSVPVTEEMKASVMEGQVMFRVRQEDETPMEFEQSVLDDFKKEFRLPTSTTVVDINDRDALAAALGYTPEEFTDEMYNDILAGYEQGGFAFYERDTKRIAIFAREELRNGIMVNNIVFHENTHYLEDENPEILELGEWLWQNSEPELRRKIKEVILESGMYEGEETYEMLAAYTGYVMSQGKADVAYEKTPSELQKHWELIFNAFGYEPRGKEIRRRGTGDNSGRVGSLRDRRDAEAEMPAQQSDIQDLTAEERRIIGEYFPEFNKIEDVRYGMSDVNTNPTEAQKKAGNYKMGHLRLDGYNITIENPKGSVRRGTDSKGNAWENTLNNDYGYIRGTEGVDGDHIDVYLSDNPTEGNVFVIDQVNPETREFDEHKVMYGFDSAEEAREAYLANFSEGWNGLGTITEVSKDEFKKWIESSHRKTKPFSEYKSVKTIEVQSEGEDMEDNLLPSTGTPTDELVTNGLQLTPAQTAEVAANIFAALPEESRKKITDGLNGNILGLKDAILQIPTSLASKENWNDEDRAMADVVAEEMTKMAGEMTRPFSAEEGLWLLYNNLNKGTDLISQASRALVLRNLGFDAETLAKQEQAKEDVRFRTVGDATSNAQASLYNRGAVNVWTRLKESYVDMNASVEELVKAIEKRTGKEAQGFENILLALNQQSSKGLAAMESYTQKFLNPMFDEIRRIMDETKMKYEDVVRYVILKHGLERNKKLAQRDARAHYQEIYDDIIAKIKSMDDRQKRTYLTNAQLKEADAKARLATLQAKDTTPLTDEELKAHKKELANARKEVKEAEEYRERAEKIRNLSEQEAQDELDKIFEKIENGTDSVYKEMRENDYSGISSMFYDQLGVDRKKFSTEEQYQAALMEAKKDRYSSLANVEAAAEAEVNSFEGKTDTKELWKRINAATKETLRQQYEANMISKDQYDSLRNMFEYYVPLRGFKDNTAEDMYTYYRKPNSTGYTKPILGAEGRKTEAESPFGWIAAMAGSAIASNVKNEAKLALYYFVSNRPENGIATISRTWFVDSGEVDERGKKIFKPAYPPFSEDLSSDAAKASYEAWQENMRELQKKGQAYEAGQRLNLGNAVVNISDANKPEHIVNVKVGGKDYTIIINGNPRAAQAINGDLNIETNDTYNNVLLGPWLRWLSSVNTSYNPEFWATNMMRDVAFTIMAVSIKGDAAYQRKFSKNYLKAFKVISLAAKNEKGTIGDSYLEEQYKDFVKYGGVTGFTQIKDSETWEKEIENYLKSQNADTTKAIRAVKDGLHAFHRFGESLEQVSRFAAFITAREMGKSMEESINDAKEITVNFNRKGSGKRITFKEAKLLTKNNGQRLNDIEAAIVSGISYLAPIARSTIMFFNAAVQALNAWFKLWKANKLRSLSWVIGYAAIGFMNALIHALLDDDDEYLDIPQYERRSSLMLGGNGVYFKWALPQEMSVFYALGELSVEAIWGRNPHQSFAAEATKVIGDVLPVNIAKIIIEEGGWVEAMPSQIKAPLELLRNENYKGDVIFNDQKWLSEGERERTANWESAYKGTGRPYIEISRLLNNLTDNKDLDEAGWINFHPESLEHVVESMTGGVGRTVSKLFNFITAAINPEEDVTVKQTPFLNRFLTINDERFKNVHVNDVFDYYEAEAEHALTLEKKYTKDRDMEALVELRGRDEYQWAKIYGRYKKPLKAIQDKIKVADGTAEKKELMKQQDELKKRMIKEISEL